MIHFRRSVENPDGQAVEMTVVYDLNGVHIMRTDSEGTTQSMLFTHEEAETILDLMSLSLPAYKKGMETP